MKIEVCIGMPIHNGGQYLEESLKCLLGQTFSDFKIIALNDGSTDNSDVIMREYAARDSRIHYIAQEKRSGVIHAWRRVAELANELYAPKYFAWYSDHDKVEVNWLEELHKTHCDNPGTVCAYARTKRISSVGELIDEPSEPSFDSGHMPLWRRLDQVASFAEGYGDIVYGLLKMNILKRCGIFRDELFPDRILVPELAIYGDIRRAPGTARMRRMTAYATDNHGLVERQLRILFPDDFRKTMPYASHAGCLLRTVVTPSKKDSEEIRFRRMYLAWLYYSRIMGKFREQVRDELKSGERLEEGMVYFQKFLAQTKGKTMIHNQMHKKLRESHMRLLRKHAFLQERYRWTRLFGIAGLLAHRLIKGRPEEVLESPDADTNSRQERDGGRTA